MRAGEFDERAFFEAIRDSGARSLLIGRPVLVVLGLPVLTADYDFWLAIDDVERFNQALAPLGLHPSKTAGLTLPDIADLIRTKRFALRPRDLEDIRLLEILREGRT